MKNQTFIRPLDPSEAFFFLSDQISCMNFVFMAERAGHLDAARIHSGLAVIQKESVLLQAAIVWDDECGLSFVAAADRPIALACREADSAAWPGWIERELSEPFAEATAPLMRCLYLRSRTDGRSLLALCFHHAIADGRSGCEILRRLLLCIAAQPPAEPESDATGLAPMRELFPEKYQWKESPDGASQALKVMTRDYFRHGPPARLPWLSSKSPTRVPRLTRLSFPPTVTRKLLAQARLYGTSIHGALCAAQLLAQVPLQESADAAPYLLSCPVDMRPHLMPVQPTLPAGVYVSVITASYLLDPNVRFWQLAQDVIAQTRLQLGRGDGHLFYNMFELQSLPIHPAQIPRFSKILLSTWQHTVVSNVGRVADVDHDPAVEAISFALCPMPYQALFSAATTYKDQLIVNVTYDAGKLDAQSAAVLIDGIRDRLLQAADAPQ